MPRQLRERRSHPSYKPLLVLPDDDENLPLPEEDASSDSAFELADAEHEMEAEKEEEDAVYDFEEDAVNSLESTLNVQSVSRSSKAKGKQKATTIKSSAPASSLRPAAMLAPGLSRPSARQNYALPLPSLNHRHRGVPLYFPPMRTLRLVTKPSIFSQEDTIWTKSIAEPTIRQRVTKAVGYNFGEGPVWELLEDRSWFKECAPGDQMRPIVYRNLRLPQDCQFLTPDQASRYLPESLQNATHSPSLTCSFGPYDVQTKVQFRPLQAQKIVDFFPESKSHVFYAGAPVWAMDWCPVHVDQLQARNYKQYLAVAPFPSHSYSPRIGRRTERPSYASIQIWSLSPSQTATNISPTKIARQEDLGAMKCELILCLDGGSAQDIKWCPLPTHDNYDHDLQAPGSRKLGVLGGTFEDGSLSFYVVPDPGSLTSEQITSGPTYVKLSPSLRIELGDTLCWSMDWANSELVATGCTNGSIAVFNVKEALEKSPREPLRPSHYFPVHQSAIRSLSWAKVPPTSASGTLRLDRDPTVILSGGYDGAQMITDIRDLRGNVMNRTRDIINSIVFSQHVGGPLASDHENTVKNFGMIPSTLGRGHALLEPSGPVWSISASDFHPQIAVGSADGTCQTTNVLKSTRRGGAVPFFIHKVFQMDYNRKSREYRMLEHFLPYEHQDRPAASRATNKKKGAAEDSPSLPVSTGAWSPEVSVTRVAWNSGSGLARAPLLASATASGLCRIDWLLGRFVQDRFPYQNVQTLRGEIEGAEDEDEGDEDE